MSDAALVGVPNRCAEFHPHRDGFAGWQPAARCQALCQRPAGHPLHDKAVGRRVKVHVEHSGGAGVVERSGRTRVMAEPGYRARVASELLLKHS